MDVTKQIQDLEGKVFSSILSHDFADADFEIVKEYRPDVAKETPRTAEELHNYFRIMHDIFIPITSCSEEFNAPFEYVIDLSFALNSTLLVLAGRGGAKTSVAAYDALRKCSQFPGFEYCLAAGNRTQASASQKYLKSFRKDPAWRDGFINTGVTKGGAEWKNGSTWSILTGNAGGVSGQHIPVLALDELEFWAFEDVEQTWGVPIDKNGFKRQWVGFSTRQKASSTMNHLVKKADTDKGIKKYQWSVFETMSPCQSCLCIKGGQVVSDPMSKCLLWEDCRGVKATKSTGWMTREYVENQKRNMSPEAWKTQYLCTAPASEGLVLYNFNAETATSNDINAGNYAPWKYNRNYDLYAVHDPAEGKKSVLGLFQICNGRMFFFDELVDDNCYSVSKVKKALYERCIEKGYAFPKLVIVDPRRTDAGEAWREGSSKGVGEFKSYVVGYPDITDGQGMVEAGLECLRTLVCSGGGVRRFFVNPLGCPRINEGILNHGYKTQAGSLLIPLDNKKPEEAYKDEMDVLRYGSVYCVQRGLLQSGRIIAEFV